MQRRGDNDVTEYSPATDPGLRAARELVRLGVAVDSGLTGAELARVEDEHAFTFADDHRAFLVAGLPTGPAWPDWRHGSTEVLRFLLDGPVDGVLFDVEHNDFWHPGWGTRPTGPRRASALAAARLAMVPPMVPVYSHRFLPAGRGTHGHPVLSIHQTDVLCYGTDLADYVEQEFGGSGWRGGDAGRSTVAFWSDLLNP